jgi:hypothetical protein
MRKTKVSLMIVLSVLSIKSMASIDFQTLPTDVTFQSIKSNLVSIIRADDGVYYTLDEDSIELSRIENLPLAFAATVLTPYQDLREFHAEYISRKGGILKINCSVRAAQLLRSLHQVSSFDQDCSLKRVVRSKRGNRDVYKHLDISDRLPDTVVWDRFYYSGF